MTIARLTDAIEALTGTVPTNAQILRVGTHLYALTLNPNPAATNAEKAVAVVAHLREHCKALVRSGAEQIAAGNSLAVIVAAGDTATGDM